MRYPLVAELAEAGVPVAVSCRVLNLARQPYYRWAAEPVGPAAQLRARRVAALTAAHLDDPTGGYRVLADDARKAGVPMSYRTAWRLCSAHGLWSSYGRPKHGKKTKPGSLPAHPDLVKRLFAADAPNRLWLMDITEHRTSEGKLYCCAIKDVYSNRIVGYSIQSRMKARIVVDAIEHAAARRAVAGADIAGCIVHSDRGSQMRARAAHRALRRHDLIGSMGKVGAAGDNAAMESFFAILQRKVLDTRRVWATRDELRLAIVSWIERDYHRRLRQDRLGRLTPVEYENTMTPAA
jgi:putative transposase